MTPIPQAAHHPKKPLLNRPLRTPKTEARPVVIGLLMATGLALLAACADDNPSFDDLPLLNPSIATVVPNTVDETAPPSTSIATNRSETRRESSETYAVNSTPVPTPTLISTPTPNVIPLPAPTLKIVVNSTLDAIDANPGDGVCDDGTGNCTLRAAIMEANAMAGADTIVLPAGLYALTVAGVDEDEARTGDLDITDDLVIQGAGADRSIIDARGLDRVIDVLPSPAAVASYLSKQFSLDSNLQGPTVDLFAVAVRGGDAINGGGIANRGGILTVTDSIVSANSAVDGGGIWGFRWRPADTSLYLATESPIALHNTTLNNNLATNEGGAIWSATTLIVAGGNISGNSALKGGAIYSSGRLTLADSTVSGNSATDGGGIYLTRRSRSDLPNGGILYDSVVENNSASSDGGGIWNAAALVLFDSFVRDNSAANPDGLEFFAGKRNSSSSLGTVVVNDTAFDDDPALSRSLKQAAKAYDIGDYDTSLQVRLALAQEGHGEAQQLLGQMYYDGIGVDQHYKSAAQWWEMASEQGNTIAQNDLGVLYHEGLGVEQDYQKAAFWYQAAASKGSQQAQLNIGGLWFNGEGVTQDYVLAAHWFAMAKIGDDSRARQLANQWIVTTQRVAAGLSPIPIDYSTLTADEQDKLSRDDFYSAMIGFAIAAVVVAGVQSDWGNNIRPLTPREHQQNYYDCINEKNRARLYGGLRSTVHASYC